MNLPVPEVRTAALMRRCRVGIDVGGTFTDFVLADSASGQLVRYKEPSVPDDPSLSVERGLPAVMRRAGISASEIELVVHGTTLALNAIIRRRGAHLGLVVSRGNRGVLEIGRSQMPNAFSFLLQKEAPLVPRDLVMEVSARIDHEGVVLTPPDLEEIDSVAARLAEAGVDAVTVMLLHGYARPELEMEVADRLRLSLPGVAISESASIWPERREYERCLMALLNAYIGPMMTDYFDKLNARMQSLGVTAPIYITSNNGGTLSLQTARRRPIDTILSGPASGVIAASAVAGDTGLRNLITVDMGGTSADMSVIQDLQPAQTTRTLVGGLPIMMPVVAVSAIGAGGGSIVWVDRQGMLKVGPDSAGASPGPVSYGRGGTQATVTDCYLVAGFIDPDRFLGGRLKLDARAATVAMHALAAALGMRGSDRAAQAAVAALRITTALMSSEIARDLAQKGEHPKNYALIAFGGAGPTHAVWLAEDAGIGTVVVPATPSTFCALGAILADVKRDFVHSRLIRLRDGDRALTQLAQGYARLEAVAAEWIATEGALLGNTRVEATADMRYADQAFDLPVTLPSPLCHQPEVAHLEELFHCVHEKVYSFRDAESRVEVTTLRLRVTGTIPPLPMPRAPAAKRDLLPLVTRPIWLADGIHEAAVYQRESLSSGRTLPGPCIIEQEDTTTMVLPGWTATIDIAGNILVVNGG